MTTWKMFNESKPLFSDLYLVKFKDGCFLGEYGVCYYSDEHKEFGEFISFYDSERDEDDEAFVSCKSIVAWADHSKELMRNTKKKLLSRCLMILVMKNVFLMILLCIKNGIILGLK